MTLPLPLLLLLTLTSSTLLHVAGQGSESSDGAALLAMRSLLVDPQGILSSWTNPPLPCQNHWFEVFCSNSRVIGFSLAAYSLQGQLATEIGLLSSVTSVDFSDNAITGTIPTEIGSLSLLQNIYLYSMGLTGTVPSEIGSLVGLQELYIMFNQLSGTIPTEFGRLTNVNFFYLYNNILSGPIPSQLGLLATTPYFHIENNRLTGQLPSQLGLATALQFAYFSYNQLTGPLPSEFALLRRLSNLFLGFNSFTGTVPVNLTSSGSLELQNNYFNGTLPSQLGALVSLTDFQIQNNLFSGPLPSEIGLLTHLSALLIFNNKFTSVLPSELGLLTALSSINIFYNSFDGTLPHGWSHLPTLNTFYAFVNNFSDSIPTSWANLTTLHSLDISNSGLNCTLPVCSTVYFWNTKTLSDSFLIITEPLSSRKNSGAIGVTPALQISCYVCCARQMCACSTLGCCNYFCLQTTYSPAVLNPSLLVTATVNPASMVQNLVGNVVGSKFGLASFQYLQFSGRPGVTYNITFTSPGLQPITSSSIFVAPCPVRQPFSSQSKWDPYACVCNAGYFYDSVGAVCTPCPVNTFKNLASASADSLYSLSCTSCFQNAESPEASTSISNCTCKPSFVFDAAVDGCVCDVGHYFFAPGGVCLPCPANEFSNSTGLSTFCIKCSDVLGQYRTTGGLTAQTNVSACVCSSGTVQNSFSSSSMCECPPGSFLNPQTSVCQQCPQNYFSDSFNLNSSCTACASFDPNTVTANETSGSVDASSCVCRPSLRLDPASALCKCPPGTFFNTDSLYCLPCPPNTFSSVYTLDSTCVPCATATDPNLVTLNGTDANTNVSACVCRSTLQADPADGLCKCPPGQFLSPQTSFCQPCPVNYFSATYTLNTTCSACAAIDPYRITLNETVGNIQASACVCRATMQVDPADGTCKCPPGSFLNPSSQLCQLCSSNSYSDSFNTDPYCIACAATDPYRVTVNGTSGNVAVSSCVCRSTLLVDPATNLCACPPGEYLDLSFTCRLCPPDTFAPTFNTNSGCTFCAVVGALRSTHNAQGQVFNSSCTCVSNLVVDPLDNTCQCLPGYILSNGACEPCGADSYTSVDGYGTNRTCLSCSSTSPPDRTTNGLIAQSSFASCVCAINFYPDAAGHCLPCSTLDGTASCQGMRLATATNITFSPLAAGLVVSPGYWLTTDDYYFFSDSSSSSSSSSSSKWFLVASCLNRGACLGGSVAENCLQGFTGPVCGVCASGYGKLGTTCTVCPSRGVSAFLAFFIIFLLVVLCVAVVYYSTHLKQSTEKMNDWYEQMMKFLHIPVKPVEEAGTQSFLVFAFKITITHLQILGFTGNFAQVWPDVLTKIFSIPASAATVNSAAYNIAIDCLVHPSLYSRAIVTFLTPAILIALVSLSYGRTLLRLQWQRYWSKVRKAVVILLYVAHPGIVNGVFQTMACYDVGSRSFVRTDMRVNCSSSSFRILRAVAIAYIIIYGFGLLAVVFYMLRRSIDSDDFTFLTAGYVPHRNFWDLVTTLRKMTLVVISLFASPSLQLFLSLWVLLASWLLLHFYKPYTKKVPHKLESQSLWVLIITVSVGSLFFNGVVDANSGWGGLFVTIILILLNFGALLLILWVGFTTLEYGGGGDDDNNNNNNNNKSKNAADTEMTQITGKGVI